MNEFIDHAKDTIHEAHLHGGSQNRNVAVITAILAAMLAIADMAEKSTQSLYLTKHISLSDDWSFYQAKSIKASILESEVNILQALPQSPALAKQISVAAQNAKRMRDDPHNNGMKQLAEQAKETTLERDRAFHEYHQYETGVSLIQIAIVLSSVSIVTRMVLLTYAGCVLGFGAGIFCLLVWSGMI